jgi:UPF0716 protein FxsA
VYPVRCASMRVFALLLIGMIIEIATLVAVGKAIGLLATVGLLVLGAVIGSALLRREGSRTLASFSEAVRTRRAPHREVADSVLIFTAGVLVAVPGFLSDVAALFLLFPPTRALISRRMARRSEQRTAAFSHRQRFGPADGVVDGAVVDGAVVDVRTDRGNPALPEA